MQSRTAIVVAALAHIEVRRFADVGIRLDTDEGAVLRCGGCGNPPAACGCAALGAGAPEGAGAAEAIFLLLFFGSQAANVTINADSGDTVTP